MKISCRLREVEELIGNMDLFHVPDDIMESDEDYQIVISSWWVHIPELHINLYEGIYCNFDEEEKEYLPDFAVTVIKEAETDLEEGDWLYYEQDGLEITLGNYYSGRYTLEAISELSCFIYIPDEEPETENSNR